MAAVVGKHTVQLSGREVYDDEGLGEAAAAGTSVTPFVLTSDQKTVGTFEVKPGGTDSADFRVDGVEAVN
ncbi:MAG: hypothetical protein AAGJ97_14115 [Planctomycetota bacterium]